MRRASEMDSVAAVSRSKPLKDLTRLALNPPQRWEVLVGLIYFAVAFALFVAFSTSFWLFVFNSFLLAVIGASALNLLMGTAGQASIGNGAFLIVGSFGTVIAGRAGLSFPLDVIVATVAGVVIGLIVGLPAVRIKGVYLAFATLAAQFIFSDASTAYQSHVVGAGSFLVPLEFTSYGFLGGQRVWALVLFVLVCAILIMVRALVRRRLGRAWRLIRDNELIAPSLGIPVPSYKLAAFAISSGLISLEGGLIAHLSGSVEAGAFTLSTAISYVAMVIIGGLDSQLGAVLGAAVVTFLPYVIENILGSVSAPTTLAAQVSVIIYGVLIVVSVIFPVGGIAALIRRGMRRIT